MIGDTSLQLRAYCAPSGDFPSTGVGLVDKDATQGSYTVSGSLYITGPNPGSGYYVPNGVKTYLPLGINMLDYTAQPGTYSASAFSLEVRASTMTGNLVVTRGNEMFNVLLDERLDASSCTTRVVVTPTS
jgi:hypothetical protein